MKKLVLFLFAATLLVSCIDETKRNTPKVFTINPTSSKVSALAQTLEYTLECDKGWEARLSDGSWATIKDGSTAGNSVAVAVGLNESDQERSDTLIITAGAKSLKVPITQNGMSSVLSRTDVTLVGMYPENFQLKATADWTATLVETRAVSDWLSIEPASGKQGLCTLSLQAKDENINVGDRNALVKFQMDGNVFYVTVTQKQTDAIIKDKDKVELSNGAQSFDINILTNVDYQIRIDGGWISQSGTKALNEKVETFTVEANPDAEIREGTITFVCGELEEVVRVYQAECDVIAFVGEELEAKPEGGNYDVELRSNVEYSIIWPDVDWIAPVEAKTQSIRTDVLSFTVAPNYQLSQREAVIVVNDMNSPLSATLTIVQGAGTPLFTKSSAYGIYDAEGNGLAVYVPRQDQIVTGSNEDGCTFRIQNPESGAYIVIGYAPQEFRSGEFFDISVKHNQISGIEDGSTWSVTPVRTEGNKVWLYSEEGYGFIIRK